MDLTVGITEGDLTGDTSAVIQRAVDIVAGNGGGSVELAPGIYTCVGTIQMRPWVRLVGSGPDTVLRRCDGPSSPIVLDADAGQTKATVADASGFREGMDIVVPLGGNNSTEDTLATITFIKDSTLYLDRRLIWDYSSDRDVVIFSGFPVIAFEGVHGATLEGLCVDGNRAGNAERGNWKTPGVFLYEARACRIADCVVRECAADGICGGITQEITIEGCQSLHNRCYGIHLGSGSARPVVRGCRCAENDRDGIYLCWRVQEGLFEGNDFSDNALHGVSIGHKDTDNVFVGNTIRGNGGHGVYFRPEKASSAGSRNTFTENAIEDNGNGGRYDCGVYVEAETADLLFERNHIGDTRPPAQRTQRVGVFAAPGTSGIRCRENAFGGHLEAATEGEVMEV